MRAVAFACPQGLVVNEQPRKLGIDAVSHKQLFGLFPYLLRARVGGKIMREAVRAIPTVVAVSSLRTHSSLSLTSRVNNINHAILLTRITVETYRFARVVKDRSVSARACWVYDIYHVLCFTKYTAYARFFAWTIENGSVSARAFWMCDIHHVRCLTCHTAYASLFAWQIEIGSVSARAFWVHDICHAFTMCPTPKGLIHVYSIRGSHATVLKVAQIGHVLT